MADGNPKRIKLEPEPEVSQPDPTADVKAKTSIHQVPSGKDQLKAYLKRKFDVLSKQNQELTTERDALMKQLQEILKGKAHRQQLLEPDQKNQELTSERDSLLHQLQEEMSKSEALRQQLLEHEQSHQSIVDSVIEENTIRVQEMAQEIAELTNQCRAFHDEVHNLTHQLEEIKEENTCSICMSPWEAQGDHRIVSLPCGHLFGKDCIRQHLALNAECPYCKQEVQLGNVRYIFGCRILPVRSP